MQPSLPAASVSSRPVSVNSSHLDDGDGHLSVATLLRQTMRELAAPVVVVSTATEQGQRMAMTASSFTSVSLAPPAILVCVKQTASLHEAVLARRVFCVNVLAAGQQALAMACAGGDSCQRFAYAGWQQTAEGLPCLGDAKAVLVCQLKEAPQLGTHSVLLAEVSRAWVHHGAPTPLLYVGGQYCTSNALTPLA